MQNLKTKIEDLINESKYEEAAQLAAKELGVELKVISHRFGTMWNEKQLRRIFTMCLSKEGESYTFDFGQSIENSFQKSKISSFDIDGEVILKMGLEGGEKQLHLEVKTTKELLRKYDKDKKLFLNEIITEDYLNKIVGEANEKIKSEDKNKPSYARRKLFDTRWLKGDLIMLINNQVEKLKNEYIEEANLTIIEPTMYDVLTCLTKWDPGSFEDFCGEFGYDHAEKTYHAVVKEFEGMQRLFTEEELEILAEIN